MKHTALLIVGGMGHTHKNAQAKYQSVYVLGRPGPAPIRTFDHTFGCLACAVAVRLTGHLGHKIHEKHQENKT